MVMRIGDEADFHALILACFTALPARNVSIPDKAGLLQLQEKRSPSACFNL